MQISCLEVISNTVPFIFPEKLKRVVFIFFAIFSSGGGNSRTKVLWFLSGLKRFAQKSISLKVSGRICVLNNNITFHHHPTTFA